jgi:hypothetical protein
MASSFELKGLTELREALRKLPQELTEEAATIVEAHATQAQSQIVNAYPQGKTGNLRRGVTRSRERHQFTARSIVRSRAKHAHLFEKGTGPRRTSKGANRGRMPEAAESQKMIPIVVRRRRAMVEALKVMVRRNGLLVD